MTMLSELDKVLEEIRKDKGIDRDVLIHALESALVKAALNFSGVSFGAKPMCCLGP